MNRERQQTPTDVVLKTLERTAGLAIIAVAGGVVGQGIALIGEAFMLNEARKELNEIRRQKMQSTSK